MDDLDQRVKSESANRRDASSRFRAMIRACLAVATADREFWTVFMALWGESLHDPALASINKAAYQRARNAIGGIIDSKGCATAISSRSTSFIPARWCLP